MVKYQSHKIILFGSLLSGKIKENSDIDLVIVKDTDKPFIERVIEVALLARPLFAIDFLVYTSDEFKKMALENNYFFNEITKGKVVYEKPAVS